MHDIEIVVIWFLLVNAGMILTLLMPWIVSESRSCEVPKVDGGCIPVHQRVHNQEGLMVLTGSGPMDKPCATSEREAPCPVQAA